MSFGKIIAEIPKSSLYELFKKGHTPEQVKQQIILDLSPFFKDVNKLDKLATRYLVMDWISYSELEYRKFDFADYARKTINTYWDAQATNQESTMEIITQQMEEQFESGNKFWRLINLQGKHEGLPLQDYVLSVMRDLGPMIEELLKPLLTEHLALYRLIRGKENYSPNIIRSYDYGVIVNALAEVSSYPELFKIPPHNLKISDWRNIAFHGNYRVKNGLIECTYGPKPNRRQINITKEQLRDITNKIALTLKILNFSHKLFCYENLNEINNKMTADNIELETESRDEVWFLILATEIAVQGYELLSFEYDETLTKFSLREMTNQDIKWRAALVTQFLQIVWQYTFSGNIELTYLMPDNRLYLHASVTDDVCKKIASGEKEILFLAQNMKTKLYF
jgi:hypothetical protein